MKQYELKKILNKAELTDDPVRSSIYLEIINDYMIDYNSAKVVISKAHDIKKHNPGFKEYCYIVYGLINCGKDKLFRKEL